MYKIIGADGHEYGPVPAEQLRQWIAAGRADATTRVQREGSDDWQPLGEIPEFADAVAAAAPVGASPPPRVGAVNAEALAAEILARGPRVQVGACIGRAWELVTSNLLATVVATALVLVLNVTLGLIMAVLPVPFGVLGLIFEGVLLGGLYWFFLKLIRGQAAEVGDAFAGFSPAFVPLMLAGLVTNLLTGVGFLFCILPGIYLAVAWIFTYALVMDKRLDFWPAMELSRKVATREWWSLFGLLLLDLLILIAGLLVCGVGVFLAAPIVFASLMYAYEDLFGGAAS